MTNDDENDNHEHIHGMMFGPDPKQIEAMQQQAQMTYIAIRHGIDSMVRGLNKDDLISLRWLLQQISDHENFKIATFYEGKISSLLEIKHKICGACGVDHEAEMHEGIDKENREMGAPEHKDVLPEQPVNESAALITEILGSTYVTDELNLKISRFRPVPPTTQVERDMMALYDLDDVYEGDNEQDAVFVGFMCKKCQMRYTSIQDRMLKPVDQCKGCFLKSAHG